MASVNRILYCKCVCVCVYGCRRCRSILFKQLNVPRFFLSYKSVKDNVRFSFLFRCFQSVNLLHCLCSSLVILPGIPSDQKEKGSQNVEPVCGNSEYIKIITFIVWRMKWGISLSQESIKGQLRREIFKF